MNTQLDVQQKEDSVPSKWNTKWYRIRERFLRFLSRLLRMPSSFEVERALESWGWKTFHRGQEEGVGRCPFHPGEPPMMKIRPSDYRCPACWNADFFHTLDAGPITEPRQLQIVIPTQRPQQIYLQARKEGAGSHTAALEAIPKWLREKSKEGK